MKYYIKTLNYPTDKSSGILYSLRIEITKDKFTKVLKK